MTTGTRLFCPRSTLSAGVPPPRLPSEPHRSSLAARRCSAINHCRICSHLLVGAVARRAKCTTCFRRHGCMNTGSRGGKMRIRLRISLMSVGTTTARWEARARQNTFPVGAREGQISDDQWGRMCAEHALPPGWESMNYEEFLAARRPRMAEIIRIAFRKLGGEASASPFLPPWFLPGAEVVWQRIGDVEVKLRAIVRDVYRVRFGDNAAAAIEGALDARERDVLARAARNRPAGTDGLSVVDYLYLAQLPALLFKSDVWQEARQVRRRAGGQEEAAECHRTNNFGPKRIAHVREVAPEKLQRASLACADVLAMLAPASWRKSSDSRTR